MLDHSRPTTVRWRILALLMGYAALVHFNRISMTVAGTERLMEQYGFSETAMGTVYSAYLVVYTVCMIPGGRVIDRWGPRLALILLGVGATIGVCLTGAVGLVLPAGIALTGLYLARGFMGAVNAPIHPGAARAVSFWIPPRLRSLGNGMVTGAALVGIAITYPLFGVMIDRFGWQTAFLISGGATAVLTLAWTLLARDRPEQHPQVNETEWRLIDPAPAHPVGKRAAHATAGWAHLLLNPNLIGLTISYAAVGYVQYLFFYWMEHYFSTMLHLDTGTSRNYSMICSLAMAAGMASGGWLADRCEARFGARRGRAMVPVTGLLLGAALVALGAMSQDPTQVVTLFALAMGAVGATEGPFWTSAIELGGLHGGASAAIFNTGGNIGGFLAPVITPILGARFGWHASIGVAAVVSVVGALLWFWIDPSGGRKSAVLVGGQESELGSSDSM